MRLNPVAAATGFAVCRARHLRGSRKRPARGGALLMVLWLSAGLAAIGMSIASSVRAEYDRAGTSADGLRASYLAAGAVERAMQWMEWGSGFSRGGAPMFWDFNKRRYTMAFPSGVAVVEAIPESSRLNINFASASDLYRLIFVVSGDDARSRQIAEAILDWRTPVPEPTIFDQFYSSIRPTFRSRHASFQGIEELLLVQGMTPDLFYGNYVADAAGRLFARGGLRDCLSVWGSTGPFDINTSSPALLEAMGAPADAMPALVKQRAVAPIDTPEKMSALIPPNPRIGRAGYSTIYSLRATARLRRADGSFSDVIRTAGSVVKLILPTGDPSGPDIRTPKVRVLRWYDDAWSQDIVPPADGMPPPDGYTPVPVFVGPAATAAGQSGVAQ